MWFFSPYCSSKARLDGKTAIVTGSNRGIGKYAALDLCRRGCKVLMACRNIEIAEETKNEIYNEIKNESKIGTLIVKKLDLLSLRSVRQCAQEINEEESKIDILVNNAGVISSFGLSEDGFEKNFAANYLGHFLLTLLLLPKIMKSENGRIINVSSNTYTLAEKNFEDINYENHPFGIMKAYFRSKLAQVLFTIELSRRLNEKHVNIYVVHPGYVNTEIVLRGWYWYIPRKILGWIFSTPYQGAQTIIHCAVDEKVEHESGHYYENCKVVEISETGRDLELARKLWDLSINWAGLQKIDPFEVEVRFTT